MSKLTINFIFANIFYSSSSHKTSKLKENLIFFNAIYFPQKNSLTDDLKFLGWAFQEYQVVIITWLILHFTIICIFFPSTRLRLYYLQINSLNSKLINSIFTALYVIYLSLIIIFCDKVIFDYKLGPVCSFAILMEKVW